MSPTALPPLAEVVPFAFSEYIIPAIFLVFAATTVAGAIIAIGAQRIIRSVCGLALACLGLAGLFYFLESPFLALMELLIYVGAVCVTIVFAVMLAEPDEPAPQTLRSRNWLAIAGTTIVVAALGWSLARLGVCGSWPTLAVNRASGSVERIGVELLTTYSMAFEVISLVLLVAILGAIAIARAGRHRA
ncbi:MAG TPA: NADH-quinone oxidoreductase subunit J [Opitutaceae bacterium]|nr:NADH-quinone oxidoreductase subunit J [Opitutaceae bacterium]